MKKRPEALYAGILMAVSTLAILGLSELLLRAFIFSDALAVPSLRHAWRYADGNFEDNYWKLAYIFEEDRDAERAGSFDPVLGWTPRRSTSNPLAIISNRAYDMNAALERPVLFFGDSFVAGVTEIDDRIPQVLDQLIAERPVLNYGVSGYGVDQIYLRFLEDVERFDDPLILVGILTRDLDRSILSIRGGQKPYFELVGDELTLKNSPITTTLPEFVEENPPRITSYLSRFVLFRLRPHLPETWFNSLFGYDEVQQKKLAVNRAVLGELKQKASELNAPLGAVIFYSWEDLQEETWRESFLKSTLTEFGIAYFDTKPLLVEQMSSTDVAIYDTGHGHPNALGNRLIADALVSWLRDHFPELHDDATSPSERDEPSF